MAVGIWSGNGKPSNLNEFLRAFANDIDNTAKNGIMINGFRLDVKIRSFICDSPARSFLKGSYFNFFIPLIMQICVYWFYDRILKIIDLDFLGVVCFNHRYGCQKCCILGVFDKDAHRTHFAIFDAVKRTDHSFRNRLQPIHHKETSLLEHLENADGSPMIDIVLQFPTSDPLHLLEEGAMKRSFRLWMKGYAKNNKKKWSKNVILDISLQILQFNRETPSDFNRKLRTLQYLSYYKATEFRTILLYLGIVLFKDVLSEKEYQHFLLLSLATRFFSCQYYVENVNLKKIARKLLHVYCEKFVEVYGESEVVSNIHNICHIADDVEHFGNLNGISTYPFESFLHTLKLYTKPSNNPLEQISRRLIEQTLDRKDSQQVNFTIKKYENASWVPELKYGFRATQNELVYKFIRVKPNVFFSIKKLGDKWFITKTGDVVEMQYAVKRAHKYFIFGAALANKTDFFTLPFSSSLVDIYLSTGERKESTFFEIGEIKCKMVCLSCSENYVFIPILHSLDDCLNVI